MKVHFTANEAGARTIRFRIPQQEGEEITQNNVREVLLDVQDRKEKILFFDGEPHFEVKFIRRAVADDPNLQLVVLQRTTDTKFFRILIDSPDELAAGFPEDARRAVFLPRTDSRQHRGQRLHRRPAAHDCGLRRSARRRADDDRRPPVVRRRRLRGHPCRRRAAGRARIEAPDTTIAHAGDPHAHGAVARGHADRKNRAGIRQALGELPPVISVNPIRQVKPGATSLLRGVDENGRESIALAYQRYGRGKTLAFPIYDSWTWQMDAKIAVEDMTHETYWRQLMRWLVDGVPDQVELTSSPEQVEPGEEVTLIAEVSDPGFLEVNDAGVIAHVTGPKGADIDVPLQWTGERNGEYRGTFTPAENGMYEARVEASRAGATLGTNVGACARRAERQRIFRRRDARAAAAPHLRGNRRRVLHAADGVVARR